MACRVACSYVLCPWSVPPSVSCYQPAGFRYSASSRMPMLFGGSRSSILLLHLRLFDLPQVPRFSFCCFSIENITQRNKILPGIEFEKSLFSSDAARRGGSAPRVKLLDNCHPLGRVRVSSKQDALYTWNGLHQPNSIHRPHVWLCRKVLPQLRCCMYPRVCRSWSVELASLAGAVPFVLGFGSERRRSNL